MAKTLNLQMAPPQATGKPADRCRCWGRQFLDDLDARGLKRPEFVIVDGAPGLEAALVALWGGDLPIQRCTVGLLKNAVLRARGSGVALFVRLGQHLALAGAQAGRVCA